jgi:hypothetical protein
MIKMAKAMDQAVILREARLKQAVLEEPIDQDVILLHNIWLLPIFYLKRGIILPTLPGKLLCTAPKIPLFSD